MPHDVAEVVIKKLSQRESYNPSPEWNYAHSAGGTCARELAYWRLSPDKALPADPELALIFAHGAWVAKEALAQLDKAGYEVTETEAAFQDPKLRLRGRIDCKIRMDGLKRPVEIKGYHPNIWSRLNSIDDFLESDREYLRRVPGQLLSYMLMGGTKGDELGILYLLNKLTGKPKQIVLKLEGAVLEWGEAMLKKLELVNKHVEKGELPERIPYKSDVCGSCAFRMHCLSEMPPEADITVLSDEAAVELLALVKTFDENREAHKRYEKADKAIQEIVKPLKTKVVVVGDWQIRLTHSTQERVDSKKMTPEERKKYLKEIPMVRKTIVNMKAPQVQEPQEE